MSDVVHGRSATQVEQAILMPRATGTGTDDGLADPSAADCRPATARERSTNGYAGTPWEFVCSITDWRGTHPYDVQLLANWCYTATSRRHPGRFGIQACASR